MDTNYYILLPPGHIAQAVKKARTLSFRATGDAGVYAYPVCIILGKTEKKGFSRGRIPFSVTPERFTRNSDGRCIIPLQDQSGIANLQRKLGLPIAEAGILFSCSEQEPIAVSIPPFSSLKLALLSEDAEGVTLHL